MKGHGVYRNVTCEDIADFFINPDNLPGLQKWVDVETLSNGDEIKYYIVKAPLCDTRDNVLKYLFTRNDDGSIFISIKSWDHPMYPQSADHIRVSYTNQTYIWPSTDG